MGKLALQERLGEGIARKEEVLVLEAVERIEFCWWNYWVVRVEQSWKSIFGIWGFSFFSLGD